jgi:hypothetical protein
MTQSGPGTAAEQDVLAATKLHVPSSVGQPPMSAFGSASRRSDAAMAPLVALPSRYASESTLLIAAGALAA